MLESDHKCSYSFDLPKGIPEVISCDSFINIDVPEDMIPPGVVRPTAKTQIRMYYDAGYGKSVDGVGKI